MTYDRYSNQQGYGFFKRYQTPAINAGEKAKLTAGNFEKDMVSIGYANVLFIYNEDVVTYDIQIAGEETRKLRIPAGSAASPSTLGFDGTKFHEITIHNLDGSTNGTADKLLISVQKDRNKEQ